MGCEVGCAYFEWGSFCPRVPALMWAQLMLPGRVGVVWGFQEGVCFARFGLPLFSVCLRWTGRRCCIF